METFRITELGRRFGLSRSTLLYYDRIGLLRPSGRSRSSYREYTLDDSRRLDRICAFREAGLELAEISRLLDRPDQDSSVLERRLRDIGREMAALRTQQRLLTAMLGTLASGPEAAGLDKELWDGLQTACGLDDAARRRWHEEFERRAPRAHHDFLMGIGLSEKESIQVRMLTKNVKSNGTTMEYFYELFEELPRQGPGCAAATLRALSCMHDLPRKPRVLDVGCGSGIQTAILAKALKTRIVAIDNHRPVLDRLDRRATTEGVEIETREMSMIDMPFEPGSFDLVWAEGSIFIVGLERGLREFGVLLEPEGYLAFTEMCWFSRTPPEEAKAFFERSYPDMRSVETIARLAIDRGYEVVDSFRLPDEAWWDDYYTPMLERAAKLRAANSGVAAAEAVYDACEAEADMFRRHCASYGYAFFVLRKREAMG